MAAAVAGPGGGDAVERLCAGCVNLLSVDGAGLSLISGSAFYSVGSCGAGIGAMDELQFTLGEGPCLDAISLFAPVLAADLTGASKKRWPAFAPEAVQLGVRAVFSLPVTVAGFPIGVLTVCRQLPGHLTGGTLTGFFLAAELAVLPLLDLLGADMRSAVNDIGSPAWADLGSMMRSEVYQAAGVLIAQLGIPPAEAMVRLRAHAFAAGLSVSDVAYQVIDHRLYLDDDNNQDRPGSER